MGFNHTVLEREMKGSGESPFALFKRNQSGLRKRISMVGSALLSQLWVMMFFLLLVLWNIVKMSTNPHSTIAPGTHLFSSLLGVNVSSESFFFLLFLAFFSLFPKAPFSYLGSFGSPSAFQWLFWDGWLALWCGFFAFSAGITWKY